MSWSRCARNIVICFAPLGNRESPVLKRRICGVNSMRRLKELYRSAVLGWIGLCLVHITAAWTEVGIGFGWLSGGIATILGLPGVIGLLVANVIV